MTARTLTTLRSSLTLLALFGASQAHASDWRWHVTPYVWATDIGVDARIDDRQEVDATLPVEDLVDDIDTIAQVRIEALNARHGVALDLFEVTMSDQVRGVSLPRGAGRADLDTEVGMTILDVAGVYDPKGDGEGLSILYGTRILDQRATIDARFETGAGTATRKRFDTSETLFDALFGVRWTKSIGERWSLRTQADVSSGQTDLTWSLGPSIGYRFGKAQRYELLAGYRTMKVDFADADGADFRMTLSGFSTGLRVAF